MIEDNLGSKYSWETANGKKYEGRIVAVDDECLYVRLEDGTIKVTEYYEDLDE